MKKLAVIAATAVFALTACGDSTDASKDAVADNVEVPADDAMAGVPEPVMDESANDEATEAEIEANEARAEAVADNAQAAVDDALSAADAAQQAQDIAAEAE